MKKAETFRNGDRNRRKHLKKGRVYVTLAAVTFICLFSQIGAAAATDRLVREETITVTAQKVEENKQDVPASIDVFSAMGMDDAGIRTTSDLSRFSNNVYMRHDTFENMLIIRGVEPFHTSLYSPAGIYIDDVSLPLLYMHNMDLLDLERVELLKGPQGTLYGKNSESGVLNMVTRKPGDTLEAKLVAGYGNYNSYRGGLSLSGPVVRERLFGGIAMNIEGTDGFYKNDATRDDQDAESRRFSGRSTLRYAPTETLDISVMLDGFKNDANLGVKRWLPPSVLATKRHHVDHDRTDKPHDETGIGQTLKIIKNGDRFNLVSVTGARGYELETGNDMDMSSQPPAMLSGFDYDNQIYSQELRVSSVAEDRGLTWLIGVYLSRDDTDIDMDLSTPAGAIQNNSDISTEGYAVFGQATFRPLDRLRITGGIRVDYQKLNGALDSRWSGVGNLDFDKDLSFTEYLPKATLAWNFTPGTLGYVSAARGYLSGGYNYAITPSFMGTVTENEFVYDPEFTWNYEIGLKTSLRDGRIIINAAAFYIDMEDKQVQQTVPGLPDATEVVNAPGAHTLGAELEVELRPLAGLKVFGGIGLTTGEFDEWVDSSGVDYDGRNLPDAPAYTFNAGVDYRHRTGLYTRIDLLGTGKMYANAVNTLKHDPYELVNIKVGYETDRFDLSVWGNNIFDENYFKSMTAFGPTTFAEDGDPLTFGINCILRL